MQLCVSFCLGSLLVLTTQLSGCSAGCPYGYVHLKASSAFPATLKSPNYPSDYEDNMVCKWRIQAPEGYVVRVFILDMKLEEFQGRCSKDTLTISNITDYPSSEVILCGSDNPDSNKFYSLGRYVDIVFRSDASVSYRGFYLQYYAVRPSVVPGFTPSTTTPSTTSCPIGYVQLYATATIKTLTSPNYPSSYDNNAHCKWTIQAPQGYVVSLRVVDFSLEWGSITCRYDSLTIYDTYAGTTLAKLCGTGYVGKRLYSSGRSMKLELETDTLYTFRGFKLYYSALTPWEVPSTLPPPFTTTFHYYFTSTPDSSSDDDGVNYVVLAVGLTGSCLVIACVCFAIRVNIRSKTRERSASTAGAGARGVALSGWSSSGARPGPAAGSRDNNNPGGVFVVPASPQPAAGGHTNLAYSPEYSEEPPSYSSLQPASPGPLAPSAPTPSSPSPPPPSAPQNVNDLAPPSYTESMIMTHPPAEYKVDDDEDVAHPAQFGVPTGAPVSPPQSPPSAPPVSPPSSRPLASPDPSDLQE